MMRLLIAKNLVKLNLLFLFFNFLIPSNFSRTFTGLPITSEINLIFLFIFLPIIFSKIDLFKFKFLTFILLFLRGFNGLQSVVDYVVCVRYQSWYHFFASWNIFNSCYRNSSWPYSVFKISFFKNNSSSLSGN